MTRRVSLWREEPVRIFSLAVRMLPRGEAIVILDQFHTIIRTQLSSQGIATSGGRLPTTVLFCQARNKKVILLHTQTMTFHFCLHTSCDLAVVEDDVGCAGGVYVGGPSTRRVGSLQ